MNREILYDAITELDDRLVEEAGTHRFAKKPKGLLRLAALAAALVLTVGVFRLLPFIGFGGRAGGGGDTEGGAGVMDEENALLYMSYAGPVLPLSAEEEVPLGVERALNFDFSPYRPDADRGRSRSEAIVTDTYTLINRTNFDRTVTLLYPFAAAMTDPATTLPQLTADGVPMEAEWVSGPYSGGFVDTSGNPEGEALNLRELSGWEAYRALLADGSYRATAFSETPVLDQPVTVYRVYDITAPEADDDTMPNPTLNMVFSMDYSKTGVLSYGSNGGSINSAVSQMQRHIGGLGGPRGKEAELLLIVTGEDIGPYTLQGYRNGGCNPGEEIEIGYRIERSETTLGEALSALFTRLREKQAGPFSARDEQTLRDVAGEALIDHLMLTTLTEFMLPDDGSPIARYQFGMLEDVLWESMSMQRVHYLRFAVTVPAGQSVTVSAEMVKEASFDFYDGGRGNLDRNGYGVMTRVDSPLTFTGLTASVSGLDHVVLLGSNMGFDFEAGVTEVTLDPATEHYWIEVAFRRDEE